MRVSDRKLLASRVAETASDFDVICPFWYREINILRLNIVSPVNCVAGQLGGGDREVHPEQAFLIGLARVYILPELAHLHGLNVDKSFSMSTAEQFRELKLLWLAEIDVRLHGDKVAARVEKQFAREFDHSVVEDEEVVLV